MKVTVTETIEHSAEITAGMVVAYALRHGWKVDVTTAQGVTLEEIAEPYETMVIWNDGRFLRSRVEELAIGLRRKPHEVLADIAGGK